MILFWAVVGVLVILIQENPAFRMDFPQRFRTEMVKVVALGKHYRSLVLGCFVQ